MTRSPLVVVTALALVLGATTPGRAAQPRPSTTTAPADAAEPMVGAIVVMRDQADLSTIPKGSRRQRRAGTERALRAKADAAQQDVRALLERRKAQGLVADVVPLWVIDAVAVTAKPSVIRELARRGDVAGVGPDESFPAAPAATSTATGPTAAAVDNVAQVDAPALWDLGYRGDGVVVANMDTGVDVTHPDLSARWRGGSNSWFDPNGEHPTTPTDVSGHGTWTMGVMVGGDGSGHTLGVAPGAKWVAVKIFNDRGVATASGIHRGFQWLLDPDGNPATDDAPDVVNNSWTMSPGSCSLDFQPDLRSLRAAGILPVFAAGNYGPSGGTSASPANNPEALAVGSVDGSGTVLPDSSRGPSACGGGTYPQVAAPGAGIPTTDVYGMYTNQTGTSLAAPHAAGALALLLEAFPGLSAERQQAALQSTAHDAGVSGPDNDSGYGRIDVLDAYRWLASTADYELSVSPAAATVAPGGSAAYDVTVMATNGFNGDVNLSLQGLSGIEATWSFTPATLTGGGGTSRLQVATSGGIAPGTYPVTITAASGSTTHSVSAQLTVPAPPSFALSATPSSVTAAAGTTAASTVGVGSQNGFTGDVALSVSGLPAGATGAFDPTVVGTAGNSTLTVGLPATTAPGTYPLTVTGTSGAMTRSVAVSLVVAPRDFSLSASPSSATVYRGKSTSVTVSAAVVGSPGATVSLSVSGLPSGASKSFSVNPVVAPGSTKLTVKASSSAKRGTFTLRITGTSGSLTRTTTVTLTVR